MRRLLLALPLLLLATTAHALGVGGYTPFQKTLNSDINHHLMWIVGDSLPAGAPYVNYKYVAEHMELQNLRTALERAGIEVHVYGWKQIHNDMKLWRFAGLPRLGSGASGDGGGYGAIFCTGWYATYNSWGTHTVMKAFFRADSTSAHLIHFGYNDPLIWDDGAQASQSNPALVVGTYAVWGLAPYGIVNHYGTYPTRFDTCLTIRNWQNPAVRDTYYFDTVNLLALKGQTRASGVEKIVTYFQNYDQPDTTSPTAYDGDLAHVGYRVYYSTPNYAGITRPYTDFIVNFGGSNSNNSESQNFVIWAILSRYIELPKIKLAMVLQGLGTFGGNPFWPNRPAGGNWFYPRASYVDTIVRTLQSRYHVNKLTITTQPDSLKRLLDYDGSWNVIKNWTHVRWAVQWATYDSLTIGRSPTGVVDVSYGDTAVTHWGTRTVPYVSRRVGNRFDPTNGTAAIRFGIPQVFAYQDSILKSLGLPICYAYFTSQLGNNVPMTSLMPLGPYSYGDANLCPVESTFVGFANAGRRWFFDQPQFGDFTKAYVGGERTVRHGDNGTRWSVIPDENYTTRDGRVLHFSSLIFAYGNYMGVTGTPATTGVYTIQAGGGGPQLPNGDINGNISTLFGLCNRRRGMDNAQLGYQYAAWPVSDAPITWGGEGRCRALMFPLRFVGTKATPANPAGIDTEFYEWELSFLKEIQCMEDLAGHYLVDWVTPEEAAEAVP